MASCNYISLDCETTGTAPFHNSRPFAVSLCWREGLLLKTKWFDWFVNPKTRQPIIPKSDIKRIREILYGFNLYVFHNAKFDIRMLELIGVFSPPEKDSPHYKVFCNRVHDTLIMSHVLDSMEDHGLKPLALKYLDFPEDDQKELRKKIISLRAKAKRKGWNTAEFGKTPGLSSSDSAWAWDMWLPRAFDKSDTSLKRYGVNDAIRTLCLFEVFTSALEQEKLIHLYEEERQLIPIFYEMESEGMPVRRKRIVKHKARLLKIAQLAERRVVFTASHHYGLDKTFNIRSPDQLSRFLFRKLNLPILSRGKPTKKNPKGLPSTNKNDLAKIWTDHIGNFANEEGGEREFDKEKSNRAIVVDSLLTHRTYSKGVEALSTYEKLSLPEKRPSGRVFVLHGSLNQTGTHFTRISSSNPNQQNVSTKNELGIREVFVPEPGTFWYDPDYAALELRIKAYLAGETVLIREFEAGRSPMLMICERLWKLDRSKFTEKDSPHYWKYKRTKNGVYNSIYSGGETKIDKTFGLPGAYAQVKRMFKKFTKFDEACRDHATEHGFVYTADGYRIWIDRQRIYTQAISGVIQGTAGRLIKRAMINLRYNPCTVLAAAFRLCKRPTLLLQVHDELILKSDEFQAKKDLGRWIKKEMEEPGQRIGIVTPVEVSIIRDSWAHPEKLEL